MPLLINRQIVADSWVTASEENYAEHINADVIVPLAVFTEQREALLGASGKLGVLINGEDDLEAIEAALADVQLVAIEFPVLRDGRGYSIARHISRSGFSGEIRATGDVAHDRLDYMLRSGFTAFDVPEERFSGEVLKAFEEMTVSYQQTHQHPQS